MGVSKIARRHGRNRGGILSRLFLMIPADSGVTDDERLDWILAKHTDPSFDWRTRWLWTGSVRPVACGTA
jgi:hypothetical protein